MVIFRDATKGFVDSDAACLKTISPLFAVALAGVVRDVDKDEEDAGGGGVDYEDEHERPRPGDEEWWKKGEQPPY